jgi:hypothetical protein
VQSKVEHFKITIFYTYFTPNPLGEEVYTPSVNLSSDKVKKKRPKRD